MENHRVSFNDEIAGGSARRSLRGFAPSPTARRRTIEPSGLESEKSQAATALAGEDIRGLGTSVPSDVANLDPKFVAAVRRIHQLGGELQFDTAGQLTGVDLSQQSRLGRRRRPAPPAQLAALEGTEALRRRSDRRGRPPLASITGLNVALASGRSVERRRPPTRLPGCRTSGSLSIRRSPLLTDKGLEYLQRMPKLTSLGLLEVGITDGGLERLAGLGRLRALDLRGCAQVGNPGLKSPPDAHKPQSLAAGRQLDRRRQPRQSWAGSASLGKPHDRRGRGDGRRPGPARRLAARRNSTSPAATASPTTDSQQIKHLTALRQLSLRGIPFSGAGLAQLRGMSRLAVLRLNETGVDDDALRRLAGLQQSRSAGTPPDAHHRRRGRAPQGRSLTCGHLDIRETGVSLIRRQATGRSTAQVQGSQLGDRRVARPEAIVLICQRVFWELYN